jgi:hypothetical protein
MQYDDQRNPGLESDEHGFRDEVRHEAESEKRRQYEDGPDE